MHRFKGFVLDAKVYRVCPRCKGFRGLSSMHWFKVYFPDFKVLFNFSDILEIRRIIPFFLISLRVPFYAFSNIPVIYYYLLFSSPPPVLPLSSPPSHPPSPPPPVRNIFKNLIQVICSRKLNIINNCSRSFVN